MNTESENLKVVVYRTPEGKLHFQEWMSSMRDKVVIRKVETRIARVRSGNFGDSKSVGEGVLELRIHYGPGYRIYLARDRDSLVVLLCGGDKSSQKKDIALAKKYWKAYKDSR